MYLKPSWINCSWIKLSWINVYGFMRIYKRGSNFFFSCEQNMSMEGKSEVEVEKQSNFCFDGQEWVLGLDHDKKLSSILVPDKDGYFLDPVRQIVPGRQNGGKPNVFWATLKETNTKVLIKPLFGSWCHFTDEDSRKPVAAYLDSIKPKFGIQAMGTKYVYLKSQIKLKQDDESDFHWTKEKTWIYNFEEERKEQKEEIGYLIIQYSGFNIPFKNFHPNANFSKFSKEEKLKLLKVVLWRTIFSSDPNSLNLLVKQSGQKVEYLGLILKIIVYS